MKTSAAASQRSGLRGMRVSFLERRFDGLGGTNFSLEKGERAQAAMKMRIPQGRPDFLVRQA